MNECVNVSSDGAIGRLTLNRSQVHNAINGDLLTQLRAGLSALSADSSVRVIALEAAGDRAFSSGIDVAWVKDMDGWAGREVGRELHRTFDAVRTLDKIVVAVVDGLCLGAGLELAISCDLIIASERSQFGLPNINVGIPAIVEAAVLPACIGIQGARELAYGGRNWDAEKAERRGLINVCVAPDELEKTVGEWLDLIAAKSPRALAVQKDIIHKWMTTDLESAIDFSINSVALSWETAGQKEGMDAFVEKREAEFGED